MKFRGGACRSAALVLLVLLFAWLPTGRSVVAGASTTATAHAYDLPAQHAGLREEPSNDFAVDATRSDRHQSAVTWDRSVTAASWVAAEGATVLSRVDRVGSALSKDDPFHRSVSWVVDNPDAQRFGITGGDGLARQLYQLPGEVNGKSGVFEWIVDESGSNPVINHQRFIPGGGVTGYPNQVP